MGRLPNAITAARALAVIPIVALLDLPAAALAAFALAALTDWVDGALARRLGATSRLGAFLDPLADKILVLGILLGLAVRGSVDALPVGVILARAGAVTLLRGLALTRGTVVPSNAYGKAKAALQGGAVVAQLAALAWPALDLGTVAGGLLWVAAAVTVATGVDVVRRSLAALELARLPVRAHAR